MNRKGDWIQCCPSGQPFWPLDPRPEEVRIEDIAHALSNQCRFSGHTLTFYSVAQHSCLVSDHCPCFPLWGLLHDAAEAYLVDLPRPVKQSLREQGVFIFDQIETVIMAAVCHRFGLDPVEPREIKAADDLLLVTEARDLMVPLCPGWRHTPSNGFPVLPDRISPWSPGKAVFEFLLRFSRLYKE